jgi:hypothetical protein
MAGCAIQYGLVQNRARQQERHIRIRICLTRDYLIAAIADEAAGNWPDEKFLTTLAGVATPLRILGNQSTTATVRVGALK